jgi:flagellar FliJ protein
VETLQKRLKEILDRYDGILRTLDAIDLEAEEEKLRARTDASIAWCHPDYVRAWKLRRERLMADLAAVELEAEGARDALASAFEEMKKIEHVAELAAKQEARALQKREDAALDEIALRNASRRP